MAYFQALAVSADKAAQVLDPAGREAQAPGRAQAPELARVQVQAQGRAGRAIQAPMLSPPMPA